MSTGRRTVDQVRLSISVGVAVAVSSFLLYTGWSASSWARNQEADIIALRKKQADLELQLASLKAENNRLSNTQGVTSTNQAALTSKIEDIRGDISEIKDSIRRLTDLYYRDKIEGRIRGSPEN